MTKITTQNNKKFFTDSEIPIKQFYQTTKKLKPEEPGKYPFHTWNPSRNVS